MQFPQNIGIDEVRNAIRLANERIGATSFIEADRGDHIIFNYVVAFPTSFPTPNTGDPVEDRHRALLRECRGLTFTKDGRLAARKYSKFFNMLEKEETQIGMIDFSQPHVILEKLDGSMLVPYFSGDLSDIDWNNLEWHTKMGRTDVARPVAKWVEKNDHYARWAANAMASGFTTIFEWCSRQQKIVIDYPEERLVLTAVRNNHSGEYLSYEEMLKAESSGIAVVKAMPGTVENMSQFLEEARGLKGAEGYVIRFDSGLMVKVKAEEYCMMHKTKEALTFEKDVWAIVLSDGVDDLKAMMDEGDRQRVENFETDLLSEIDRLARELEALVAVSKIALSDDKKRFALEIAPTIEPALLRPIAFKVWAGSDARESIKSLLARNCGSSTKVDEIRHLVGGISWDTYRDVNLVLDA